MSASIWAPGTVVPTGYLLATDLANTSDSAKGDTLVGVKSVLTGAVGTTQHEVNARTISVFDFMTAAQIADVLAGTMTLDVSAAVQAWVAACESDSMYGGRKGHAPGGKYRLDGEISFSKQNVTIAGDGMFATQFYINTPGNDGFVASALYFRPTLRDFAIVGPAASGHALNLNGAGTTYNGTFDCLYLISGDTSFYGGSGSIFFSCEVNNVVFGSYSGHGIHTDNGPAANFRGCYGLFAGAGKALYRMAGNVHLDGCNGGNDPGYDWWGVFGNDTASADGFQADFATADYADVCMVGCNIEYFASRLAGAGGGLRFQTQLRGFQFIGGKFDRSALSTAYVAVIQARAGMIAGQTALNLSPAWFQPGAGTPSLAHIYADTTAYFCDANGQIAQGGTTTYKVGANTYPMITSTVAEDVYLGTAQQQNAISPRRLTVQMTRYKTVTRTPVGAGQAIDVTGYSKVIVSPAAAASITTATFTATVGADLDAERNGELVIEAGNANLTINHTARGGAANSFVMTAGANLAMAAGQIVRFLRSETGSQWQQV